MKIDAYGSATTESASSLTTSVADTVRSRSAGHHVQQVHTEDTTSFTSGAASVQALTDAAFATTSRAARIASLQQTVRSGQYTVDPATIAAALSQADV